MPRTVLPAADCSTADSVRLLIERRAAEDPDRPFLEDARSDRAVTYGELLADVRGWGEVLAAHRVPAGGRVALCVSDPLSFAVAHLAVLVAGGCSCPLDPDAPQRQRDLALARLGPDLLLTDRELPAQPCAVLLIDPAGPAGLPRAARPSTRSQAAVLLLTSGTTGHPKGIRLAEGQLLHTAGQVVANQQLTSADRCLNPLPMFHINAQVVALLGTLVSGGTLVLQPRFSRTDCWSLVAERQITWLNAVPAILGLLAREPVPGSLPELRFIRSASAPLPSAVLHRLESATGVPVLESYGMTEAGSQIAANPLGGARKAGSVGLPLGTAVRVLDDDGLPCTPGTTGTVHIRGAGVITGYLDGEHRDRIAADGWLCTGDVGELDADGYLFLAGRADDVINRGGEKVLPRIVEDALLGDDAVAAVAVVGQADDILGAVPVAYVVPVPGADTAGLVERLQDRCDRELARFERPRTVHLVHALPQTTTGKVQRHLLRERADQSANHAA